MCTSSICTAANLSSTLRALKPNDIAATVNLTGLGPGAHTVNVSVSAPADTLVANVSPETVAVTLEAR